MSKLQKIRSQRFSQLLGLELKANLARHEVSQAEIAEELGHSKSGYSRWLNAKPSMPLEAFLNTCELIGVDPREVMDAAYCRLLEEMGPREQTNADTVIDRIVAHPEDYDIAALYDPNDKLERETPRE